MTTKNTTIDGVTTSNNSTNNSTKQHIALRILEGFRNYIVYSNGTVKNCKTDRLLNSNSTKAGYRTVTMRNDKGIRKTFSVHKLIYETFIGEVP